MTQTRCWRSSTRAVRNDLLEGNARASANARSPAAVAVLAD